MTNNLAYYNLDLITEEIFFTVQAQGPNFIHVLLSLIHEFS